ncbi:MAG: hypothetical protein HY436_00835, partial [Candidatus Liptonbacteria bacterium]|nr:hypothetical protein [Candidatus Liptonbacteria bacterium]
MKQFAVFVRQTGTLTLALVFAFAVFMGFEIARGQFTPPPTAPPGGNVPPPINVGSDFQAKSGALGAADVWSDAFGDWVSALRTPVRYHLEMHPTGLNCERLERTYENLGCPTAVGGG